MHEFMSLKMLSPHLLHCTLTSDEKISTSSPQRGHFLIVRVGVRKRAVPGQLLNNTTPFPGVYISVCVLRFFDSTDESYVINVLKFYYINLRL